MAILKLKKGTYTNVDATDNLMNYLLDEEKMPSKCFGGNGVSLDNPAGTANTATKVFGQTTGKQAEHFILAFDNDEKCRLNIELILKLAYDICDFFQGVQILFALHERKNTYVADDWEDDKLHIHFALNTVNVYTGYKFRIDFNNEFDLKNYILSRLIDYNISQRLTMIVD